MERSEIRGLSAVALSRITLRSIRATKQLASQPPDATEAPVQSEAGERHHPHDDEIAVLPLQLRDVLEVHPVDAGDGGRDGEDRKPGGELLRHRRLLRLADQQARL